MREAVPWALFASSSPFWAPLDQSESQRHVPVYRNHVPLDDCCAARGLAVYPKPEASFVGRPAPSFPQPLGGRVKEVLGTPRALREACWTADNGGARWRWPPPLSPITAAHLVIIMNAVGFWVAFLAHPINGLPVVSTWTRSVRSTRRPSNSASHNTSPRASKPRGLLQKQTVDNEGGVEKSKVLLHPVWFF